MKERLLTAFAIKRNERAHCWWGVPYSPYGSSDYTHTYPLPFFDFATEVKLGVAFWNFIGHDGTYAQLLDLYAEVGEEFAPEIAALRAT